MRGKRVGRDWMAPVARRSWPRERRRVHVRRKVRREREGPRGLLKEWREEVAEEEGGWWVGDAVGASRSERVPVRRRARVEVMATMETCVAAELEGGAVRGGGYRVPIMVPRLLMNASPGPVTRKNPPARNHMVGSARKWRVSMFRSHAFLRISSSSRARLASASRRWCSWSSFEGRPGSSMVP